MRGGLTNNHQLMEKLKNDQERVAVAIFDKLLPLFEKGLTDSQIKARYREPGLNDSVEIESEDSPGSVISVQIGKYLIDDSVVNALRALHKKYEALSPDDSQSVALEAEMQRLADIEAEKLIEREYQNHHSGPTP